MNNIKNGSSSRFVITSLIILSIIIVTFLTYRDILSYYFTSMDGLPLIETSRIHSLTDLKNIFTYGHNIEPELSELLERGREGYIWH